MPKARTLLGRLKPGRISQTVKNALEKRRTLNTYKLLHKGFGRSLATNAREYEREVKKMGNLSEDERKQHESFQEAIKASKGIHHSLSPEFQYTFIEATNIIEQLTGLTCLTGKKTDFGFSYTIVGRKKVLEFDFNGTVKPVNLNEVRNGLRSEFPNVEVDEKKHTVRIIF